MANFNMLISTAWVWSIPINEKTMTPVEMLGIIHLTLKMTCDASDFSNFIRMTLNHA